MKYVVGVPEMEFTGCILIVVIGRISPKSNNYHCLRTHEGAIFFSRRPPVPVVRGDGPLEGASGAGEDRVGTIR